MLRAFEALFLVAVLMLGLGCATTQSRFAPITSQVYTPLPDSFDVQVFRTEAPKRAYVEVARLDVHLEVTHFIRSTFENALPELKKQARQSGSHAIIKIEERRSRVGETMIYHLNGVGIRYTDE